MRTTASTRAAIAAVTLALLAANSCSSDDDTGQVDDDAAVAVEEWSQDPDRDLDSLAFSLGAFSRQARADGVDLDACASVTALADGPEVETVQQIADIACAEQTPQFEAFLLSVALLVVDGDADIVTEITGADDEVDEQSLRDLIDRGGPMFDRVSDLAAVVSGQN